MAIGLIRKIGIMGRVQVVSQSGDYSIETHTAGVVTNVAAKDKYGFPGGLTIMALSDILVTELGNKLEELFEGMDPFYSEANRKAFRAAWETHLESVGVTEEDFTRALDERLDRRHEANS